MRKDAELSNPISCMNRAEPTEMTFVLLGRDNCAPETIRHWCLLRVAKGKNTWDDEQIQEALACALVMEDEAK